MQDVAVLDRSYRYPTHKRQPGSLFLRRPFPSGPLPGGLQVENAQSKARPPFDGIERVPWASQLGPSCRCCHRDRICKARRAAALTGPGAASCPAASQCGPHTANRTTTGMQRMKGLLRSTRNAVEEPDEAAGVAQLASQVSSDTVTAFAGTSELPSGPAAESEVQQLLRRYWRAEKGSIVKAAQRLEQQAAWRRRFGTVAEVSGVVRGARRIVPASRPWACACRHC